MEVLANEIPVDKLHPVELGEWSMEGNLSVREELEE